MMKIRTDFVTNSSSSSYIMAYKTLPNIDDETIAKYPFLKGYAKMVEKVLLTEGDNDTDAGEVYSTLSGFEEYVINNWGWRDADTIEKICAEEEYVGKLYSKSKEYLEKGYNILVKSVDHNDTYCSNIIHELAKDNDNFVILEDE